MKVLLIGPPFLYDLVDAQLLRQNNIQPLYAYESPIRSDHKPTSVYYQALSLQEISDIIVRQKVDAIVCFNDNFLLETAQLRDQFHLPGYGTKAMRPFKMKSAMYEQVRSVVDVPKTLLYQVDLTFAQIQKKLGQSAIFIKPDYLAGAEGACLLTTEADFARWRQHHYQASLSYICQPYFDLPLVHCEVIIENQTVIYQQARRYSYPNHQFLQGQIIASFPIADQTLSQKVDVATVEVARQLQFNHGVMHTEFFVAPDQSLIFLETNIRQAGGAINLVHRRRAGISMETAMILLECGVCVPIVRQDSGYSICGYIPRQKGMVTGVEIPQLAGCYQFYVYVKEGDILTSPSSASHKAAAFIGHSDSLHDLEQDFRYLENHSIIHYDS